MIEIVFLIPLATGALAFFLPRPSGRTLLTLTGAVHLVLSILLWVRQPQALFAEYFAVTPEGLLSLLVISLLFFLISIYTKGYLEAANIRSERVFTGSMLVFLSTMMIPWEATIIPNYLFVQKIGWDDTYLGLMAPFMATAFGTFLIRQYFLSLPKDLYDAAVIDGCSNLRYLITVAVPLAPSTPAT